MGSASLPSLMTKESAMTVPVKSPARRPLTG